MSGRKRKVAPVDPGESLPLLAKAAADRFRRPEAPLSRSEALLAAPRRPSMPAVWERAFRAAFADRLEELGVATPAKRGGASGPSGKTDLVQARLYLSAAEQREQQAKAKAAGLSWSTWARRKLAT